MKQLEAKGGSLIFVYIAITLAVCQGVWVARLVKEIMGVKIEAVKIMVNNQ